MGICEDLIPYSRFTSEPQPREMPLPIHKHTTFRFELISLYFSLGKTNLHSEVISH